MTELLLKVNTVKRWASKEAEKDGLLKKIKNTWNSSHWTN
jgi:hypothetical protein